MQLRDRSTSITIAASILTLVGLIAIVAGKSSRIYGPFMLLAVVLMICAMIVGKIDRDYNSKHIDEDHALRMAKIHKQMEAALDRIEERK